MYISMYVCMYVYENAVLRMKNREGVGLRLVFLLPWEGAYCVSSPCVIMGGAIQDSCEERYI